MILVDKVILIFCFSFYLLIDYKLRVVTALSSGDANQITQMETGTLKQLAMQFIERRRRTLGKLFFLIFTQSIKIIHFHYY